MRWIRRRTVARAVAAVAAVFWGFLWFGLIDLLVVVQQDVAFHQDYMFESGWGLLYLVLIATPLIQLAFRPGTAVALSQLAVVTTAVLVGAVWGARWPQLWTALGLAFTVATLAWTGRGQMVRPHVPDPVLLGLAIVGLPAAVWYGAPLARNTVHVEDITNGVSHYPMQASLALAVVGLVALAAVTPGRLPAWTAALSAAWLGIESIIYPRLTASLGIAGGVLTVVWALLVLIASELARRRTLKSGDSGVLGQPSGLTRGDHG